MFGMKDLKPAWLFSLTIIQSAVPPEKREKTGVKWCTNRVSFETLYHVLPIRLFTFMSLNTILQRTRKSYSLNSSQTHWDKTRKTLF